MDIDTQALALKIAQRLRTIAVKETIPVGKGSKIWRIKTKSGRVIEGGVTKQGGELRRSVHVSRFNGGAVVGTNKVYARAVHEGRRALIIRPRKKKALAWNAGRAVAKKVFQPAREGNPFFRNALDIFQDGFDNEIKVLNLDTDTAQALKNALLHKGLKVRDINA